jgi:hypothetical protein
MNYPNGSRLSRLAIFTAILGCVTTAQAATGSFEESVEINELAIVEVSTTSGKVNASSNSGKVVRAQSNEDAGDHDRA